MRRMRQFFWQLLKCDDGPTAVEYAVVIAMVLLVCIGAVNSVGSAVSKSLQNTTDLIGNASGGGESGSSGAGAASSGSGSGSGGGGKGAGKGGGKGRGS